VGLENFMEQHGVMFDVRRAGQSFQAKGLRNNDRGGRDYIGFYPNTDLQVGDTLHNTVTLQDFQVTEVDYDLIHGEVLQVKAYFETGPRSGAHADRQQASSVFNYIQIGQASNVQIQQGTVGSDQSAETPPAEQGMLTEILDLLRRQEARHSERASQPSLGARVQATLTKVLARERLSECITEVLALALESRNGDLETFCRRELGGWVPSHQSELPPAFRQVEAFVSPVLLRLADARWKTSDIFAFMQQHPQQFALETVTVAEPIATVESVEIPQNPTGILLSQTKLGNLVPGAEHADAPIYYYVRPSSYTYLLDRIRGELTAKLLTLLPSASPGGDR
jgi:hypothetical protein